MNDMRQIVARNLRALRHAKKLSQEELAFRAGIDRSYISLLENGRYSASVETLGKLAQALDAEPQRLLEVRPRKKRPAGKG